MYPPFPPRVMPSTPPPSLPVVRPRPTMAAWGDMTIPTETTVLAADARLVAVLSQFPASPPRPELNQYLSGDAVVLKADAQLLSAGLLNLTITGVLFDASALLLGTYVSGTTIPATATLLIAAPELRYGGVIVQPGSGIGELLGSNWLKWSKIGVLDFTIDRSNVAGQMPLPWRGSVWAILRRGQQIIVYGKNGVIALHVAGTAFGHTPILNVGLKSKQAVIDTGEAHYFIDSVARLWRFGNDGPQLLDYREWLGTLGSPVLSYHPERRLLYCCDGTNGYVYNVDTGSLGKGPVTVTGLGLQSGTLYAVASGTMTIPNFTVTTDVTDFGSRKGKTIHSLEIGVDSTLTLEGAIDYRLQKQAAFLSTNWYPFDSRGQLHLNAYGYEFRFKVRATAAGWFHLDSLRVYGSHHAH